MLYAVFTMLEHVLCYAIQGGEEVVARWACEVAYIEVCDRAGCQGPHHTIDHHPTLETMGSERSARGDTLAAGRDREREMESDKPCKKCKRE